jgi:hypothetical protein
MAAVQQIVQQAFQKKGLLEALVKEAQEAIEFLPPVPKCETEEEEAEETRLRVETEEDLKDLIEDAQAHLQDHRVGLVNLLAQITRVRGPEPEPESRIVAPSGDDLAAANASKGRPTLVQS